MKLFYAMADMALNEGKMLRFVEPMPSKNQGSIWFWVRGEIKESSGKAFQNIALQ